MDAYFRTPWPTVFMPVSIVLSSKNNAVKSTEYLLSINAKVPARIISI
jgi:hypothetical protein